MKKQILTAAAAGLLSVAMMMTAFAATEGGAVPTNDGTDVYAGVILDDPDAKIKVYVPTLFAFVVNGSVSTDATDSISVDNGNLLLPNVKVQVDGDSYSVQTVGEGNMYFENCSTAIVDGERAGIPVSIKGSIKNEGTEASRNGWVHVGDAPTTAETDVKHYRLNVEDVPFTAEADGTFQMQNAVELEAPDLGTNGENMDANGYAISGSQKQVDFGVEVGGQQKDYNQVEESAKIGNIVWTISYKVK